MSEEIFWVVYEEEKKTRKWVDMPKEYLAKQIASIHNLAFYLDLVKVAREHILVGDFYEWKTQIIPQLKQRL